MQLLKVKQKTKGMTFIEVLISLMIVTMIIMTTVDIIFTIYKANILVSAMLGIDSEATYVKGMLESMLGGALPNSLDCTVTTNQDFNGDNINDDKLIGFSTLDNRQYYVVRLRNLQNPQMSTTIYNPLVLVGFDPNTNTYQLLNMLTSPIINVREYKVRCSNLIDVPEKGYQIRSVNIDFTFDSTLKQNNVFGKGDNTPIVGDYKTIVSKAVIN